jgi:hypothetical protein
VQEKIWGNESRFEDPGVIAAAQLPPLKGTTNRWLCGTFSNSQDRHARIIDVKNFLEGMKKKVSLRDIASFDWIKIRYNNGRSQ